MVFNWLFAPQFNKITSGYYINHDNLVTLSTVERKKAITSFIALQTPEKLDPADRNLVLDQ
jgi:hypothetical protein